MVISGPDKGKSGKVLTVDKKANRAIVEELNKVSRHTKPNTANPNGGIVEKEAAIHISNLMVIEPKTGNPTRIGRKKVDGKSVRYSKKTGEVID